MTISTTDARLSYNGNGVTTNFSVSYPFFGTSTTAELEVIERNTSTGAETTKTNPTDYTVSGGSGSTGTVTAVTAPASGVSWTIRRKTTRTQLTDYEANDPFPAQTHERALDRAMAISQELEETLSRSLTIPKTDSSSLNMELPSSVDRASSRLGFNSSGEPIAVTADITGVAATAFAETLLDDSTAAEARTTLDAMQDVFTTRGDLVRAGASGVAERVALGASGQFLKSDGTDAVWAAPTPPTMQIFTSSDTWTKPTGCTAVYVEVQGPGGGGGGATGGSSQIGLGSGGGSGEYAAKYITSGLGSTETVTVGTGGVGGVVNATSQNGSNGSGNSSFGSHVSAAAGSGGAGLATGTSNLVDDGGAGGDGGTGGDFHCKGTQGGLLNRISGTVGISGTGAPSKFGGGGEGASGSEVNGGAGEVGGGGGGARSGTTAQRAGGNGGDGIVIVWEFYG